MSIILELLGDIKLSVG